MVRFSRVSLRYPDPLRGPLRDLRGGDAGADTLRDLSFTLPQGSFTWLTGPSGAGKTSLLRLMQLALRPTAGEVEVLGTPVARARRSALPALRRRIGAVFQEFRLLPYLTAFDNVALPLRLAGRTESSLRPDVTEILRWVGLSGKEGSLPPQLSGGEQQRVALARAVVTRPALLVADEPTGNLDPEQARRVLALLVEMNRLGTTVVVATHAGDLMAAHPGEVMALEAGRLAAHVPWPWAAQADASVGGLAEWPVQPEEDRARAVPGEAGAATDHGAAHLSWPADPGMPGVAESVPPFPDPPPTAAPRPMPPMRVSPVHVSPVRDPATRDPATHDRRRDIWTTRDPTLQESGLYQDADRVGPSGPGA